VNVSVTNHESHCVYHQQHCPLKNSVRSGVKQSETVGFQAVPVTRSKSGHEYAVDKASPAVIEKCLPVQIVRKPSGYATEVQP
jgi:hypothetical protein